MPRKSGKNGEFSAVPENSSRRSDWVAVVAVSSGERSHSLLISVNTGKIAKIAGHVAQQHVEFRGFLRTWTQIPYKKIREF